MTSTKHGKVSIFTNSAASRVFSQGIQQWNYKEKSLLVCQRLNAKNHEAAAWCRNIWWRCAAESDLKPIWWHLAGGSRFWRIIHNLCKGSILQLYTFCIVQCLHHIPVHKSLLTTEPNFTYFLESNITRMSTMFPL